MNISWSERWQNLVDDWSGNKKEIRYTAVGWQPNSGYTEDLGCTPSGEREFYRIVTSEPKPPMPPEGTYYGTDYFGNDL